MASSLRQTYPPASVHRTRSFDPVRALTYWLIALGYTAIGFFIYRLFFSADPLWRHIL